MTDVPLLVTDLDGTLWFDGEACHPRSLEAFTEIQSEGIPILIATGRRYRIVASTFARLHWKVPCLLLNGSLCYDFKKNERLFSVSFTEEENLTILNIFESHGLSPTIYADDSFVYANNPTTSRGHLEAIGSDIVKTDDLNVYSLGREVLNFCILGIPIADLINVAKDLNESGLANPSLYEDHLFDGHSLTVQPFNVSKWSGILQWCEHNEFTPSRVIAVGDAGNDIEMLTHADISVVVAGAEQRLLDLADHVIPSPSTGGWADVINLL